MDAPKSQPTRWIPANVNVSREQVLEILRHALGARWVKLVRKGEAVVDDQRRGLLRGKQPRVLTIDIRGSDPPLQLVCALTREPTMEDTVLASAVARTLAPERTATRGDVGGVLDALRSRDPQRMLVAALQLARVAAGALASDPERIVTEGPGRPTLRKAAQQAIGGTSGTISVDGRTFLAIPLGAGALVLEGAADTPALQAFAELAAGDARASETPARAPEDVQALVLGFPIPVLAVDDKGRLSGVSAEAEHLLGLTADFDLGVPVSGKLRSPELETLASGGPVGEDVVLSGRRFEPVSVKLPSGGRVVALIDKSREENLDRIQEDLVANVAHELRTPVAAVSGLMQLLRLRAGKLDPDKLALLLADGEREVTRLERMIEDLLLTARIVTGGIAPNPDVIDLGPIATQIVDSIRQRYPDHMYRVEGDLEALGDPALVRHALWHLLDNASKYSPAESTVTVQIGESAAGIEIHVSDEGEGIFTGDIPRLFQRFEQLDATSTRRVGGSGLGLFMVKAVIEAQGGSVWVRSRLGQGSTFSFRLPKAPPE